MDEQQEEEREEQKQEQQEEGEKIVVRAGPNSLGNTGHRRQLPVARVPGVTQRGKMITKWEKFTTGVRAKSAALSRRLRARAPSSGAVKTTGTTPQPSGRYRDFAAVKNPLSYVIIFIAPARPCII